LTLRPSDHQNSRMPWVLVWKLGEAGWLDTGFPLGGGVALASRKAPVPGRGAVGQQEGEGAEGGEGVVAGQVGQNRGEQPCGAQGAITARPGGARGFQGTTLLTPTV